MKAVFTHLYLVLALTVSLVAAWWLVVSPLHLTWLGVLLTGIAPLLNRLFPYDQSVSLHHKVKLPRVSALVLIGLAVVLLTVPERGWPIWLALAATGGFLLDSYWARADS